MFPGRLNSMKMVCPLGLMNIRSGQPASTNFTLGVRNPWSLAHRTTKSSISLSRTAMTTYIHSEYFSLFSPIHRSV